MKIVFRKPPIGAIRQRGRRRQKGALVSLYKNDRARYEEILSTEKSVTSQDGQNSGEQRTAHGKATAEEEWRKTNMAEISNPAEQEFIQWLPNAVTPSVLKGIQKSYAQINVLLNEREWRR